MAFVINRARYSLPQVTYKFQMLSFGASPCKPGQIRKFCKKICKLKPKTSKTDHPNTPSCKNRSCDDNNDHISLSTTVTVAALLSPAQPCSAPHTNEVHQLQAHLRRAVLGP